VKDSLKERESIADWMNEKWTVRQLPYRFGAYDAHGTCEGCQGKLEWASTEGLFIGKAKWNLCEGAQRELSILRTMKLPEPREWTTGGWLHLTVMMPRRYQACLYRLWRYHRFEYLDLAQVLIDLVGLLLISNPLERNVHLPIFMDDLQELVGEFFKESCLSDRACVFKPYLEIAAH
jgi:hypothetical protein